MPKNKTATEVRAKMQEGNHLTKMWSDEILKKFNAATSFDKVMKLQEAKEYWAKLKEDFGVPTDMKVTDAKNIPDVIKRMIDKVPEERGDLVGLNFIHARHWKEFKAMMLLSGARIDEHKWISVETTKKGWVHIGMRQAVNVGDLDIFFGIQNGTYHMPTGVEHQQFPGFPKSP